MKFTNTDTRLNHKERGATALTLALAMVVLMGMAAIAIDAGLGFNERRLDQNTVDSAVMAGAVELVLGGSVQNVVDQVKAYVDVNVRPVNDAEWVACQDPDQLELTIADDFPSVSPSTECISFETFQKIRVRLPDQEIETTFGKIIGLDTITTQAAAEALAIQIPGAGNSPPFVALADSSGGDQICLRTSSSGPVMPPLMTGNGFGTPASLGSEPDPCDDTVYDPNSEFFGALDPLTYFNNQTGAVTCKSNLVEYAIAAGIDHNLKDFEPDYQVGVSNPLGVSVIEDDCSPEAVNGVNTMPLKTGLSASELRCGMLTSRSGGCSSSVPPGAAGGSNVPARLHLGPYKQSTHTFLGEEMDNKPVWDFMSAKLGTWPMACQTLYDNRSSASWDYFDKKDELITCLAEWDEGEGQLFLDSIILTPRFAWIPLLAEDNLTTDPDVCPESGGSKCVHFNDFVPVYMQTLYTLISGGGSAGACDDAARHGVTSNNQRWGRHDAGEPIDCGRNNGNLDRLSAIVMDCGMFSKDVCDARPGFPPGGDITPQLELTR